MVNISQQARERQLSPDTKSLGGGSPTFRPYLTSRPGLGGDGEGRHRFESPSHLMDGTERLRV